ncbi:hypothetical protein ACQP2X_15635 [Actinoplanes sp. CA-131856]
MTTTWGSEAALWQAVAEHASAWANLPVLLRFAAQLPRNAGKQSSGLPGLLQHVDAGGGMVSCPLRLGTNVPQMLPLVHGHASSVPQDVLKMWLEDANLVERAHRVTVSWLRSRLPGYPRLPAPHLARATPLTTNEFTWRLTWTREELVAGFQFQNPPVDPLQSLGATAQDAARASEAARRLAVALAGTEQWQRLQAADAALSLSDRTELVAARKVVADASKPNVVDAHEPYLAIPRDAYRQQVVDDAVGALMGPAREYADAFDGADRLIELACSDVFGQLAVYGTVALNGVTDLAAHAHGPGTVEFTVDDTIHLDTGSVVWLDDPLLADALYLTGFNLRVDHVIGARIRATGQVLFGSAAVWSRPAP